MFVGCRANKIEYANIYRNEYRSGQETAPPTFDSQFHSSNQSHKPPPLAKKASGSYRTEPRCCETASFLGNTIHTPFSGGNGFCNCAKNSPASAGPDYHRDIWASALPFNP